MPVPAPISISTDNDLKRLFERLITDIIDAGGYLRLHHAFESSFADFQNEVRQTPAFWISSERAILEAGFIRLARVYDQDRRCLSLSTLLHTIGRHKDYFEDNAVLQRVSKAYAEEFKAGSHVINAQRLSSDIALVSASDPLVTKLIQWRSNFGAHLSTKPILRLGSTPQFGMFSRIDGLKLVERAFSIFNHYLVSFEGASYSTKIIGEDDYKFLFELLRLGLQKYTAQLEES